MIRVGKNPEVSRQEQEGPQDPQGPNVSLAIKKKKNNHFLTFFTEKGEQAHSAVCLRKEVFLMRN